MCRYVCNCTHTKKNGHLYTEKKNEELKNAYTVYYNTHLFLISAYTHNLDVYIYILSDTRVRYTHYYAPLPR